MGIMGEKEENRDHIEWFNSKFPNLINYIKTAYLSLGKPFGKAINMNDVIREREKFRRIFKY